MDKGNYSMSSKDNDNQYGAGFLSILPLLFTIILLGNGLLILAIKSFRIRRVPDLLVGSLAVIDLLNDLGPVLMSIIVFQRDSNGFRDLQMHTLCHVYNWMSACLRLSASFISTLMALDCVCATLRPLFYRTEVTRVNVAKIIGCSILSAAFIAAWPAIGWGRVNAHRGLCSFDFGNGFALFIAILGYIQLSVVLTSFIAVSLKMRRYQGRLDRLKRGRTLTFQDGKLQAIETSTQRQDNRIKEMEEKCKQGNDDVPTTTRKISTLPELAQENHPRSPRQERINSRIKESRQFIKILQSAVFLFYVSWLPIVISITLELATQKHRDVLQSLSAQMSLVNSIFNPWVYCALSRPYRKAYIYVLRRVGRVCGIKQSRPADIMALNNMSSRLRTSTRRIFPDARY